MSAVARRERFAFGLRDLSNSVVDVQLCIHGFFWKTSPLMERMHVLLVAFVAGLG
jgi:hypothetical protein